MIVRDYVSFFIYNDARAEASLFHFLVRHVTEEVLEWPAAGSEELPEDIAWYLDRRCCADIYNGRRDLLGKLSKGLGKADCLGAPLVIKTSGGENNQSESENEQTLGNIRKHRFFFP